MEDMFAGITEDTRHELLNRARDLVKRISANLRQEEDLDPEIAELVMAAQAIPGLPLVFTQLGLEDARQLLVRLVAEDVRRRY